MPNPPAPLTWLIARLSKLIAADDDAAALLESELGWAKRLGREARRA